MEIISKLEASLLGLKHFFTGVPCRNGHVANRLVSSGTCIECNKAKRARYAPPTGFPRGRPRADENRPVSINAVKCAEYRKKRLAQDPVFKETMTKYSLDWREKNRERSNEIARAVYQRKKLRKENGNGSE
jgi:hypothetical protein